jgi:flavodoxin
MKSLVVYYSRSGNAKFVAETIAKELGSDIEEIVDLKKRLGKLGYFEAGTDANRGKETKIAPQKLSPTDYGLIVVGGPVWAWSPPPAIRTYIHKNNGLSGRKVALFFTQDGPKPYAVDKTKALMPKANFAGSLNIRKALENKAETEKKIVEWCTMLKAEAPKP